MSILTATFDTLEGLRETVASVAAQTFTDHEHIVIDGGSTDGTAEWLRDDGESIKWISEPDEGIADALNKGLKMASGEWVLVLHAEDAFIDERSLERAVEWLETTASEIVSCDVEFVTGQQSRSFVSRGGSPRINFKSTIPHQGAFCRRGLFAEIGPYDTQFMVAMDYELFLRAHRSGVTVDVRHATLSRMPNTGVSSRLDWPSLRARFDEERAVHRMHCPNLAMWMLYRCYWPLYLGYRRARFWFSKYKKNPRRPLMIHE